MLTKKKMLEKVQDIMTGYSGYTHIAVTKIKTNEYTVDLSITYNDIEGDAYFKHCCNEIDLDEIEEMFENQIIEKKVCY